MSQITFAIIGTGWRAEFFTRVVAELPGVFRITGALARNRQKGEAFAAQWGIPVCNDVDTLLAAKPDYVILSVPREANPGYILELAKRGVPVLIETPPAPDIPSMTALMEALPKGAKAEVAEQYPFHPIHAAVNNVIADGLLGEVNHAQVSYAHGYHGVSLIRILLGVGYGDATISARTLTAQITEGPDRNGPPAENKIKNAEQMLALLDFGGKTAIFDFMNEQYFSYIRRRWMHVRGTRGEVIGDRVSYLKSHDEPCYFMLERRDAGHDGNLYGYCHLGIVGNGKWYYKNNYAPARLTDDEVAIAECLYRMGLYANGGESFYSINEGAQDLYIDQLMQQAARTGESIKTSPQCWRLS